MILKSKQSHMVNTQIVEALRNNEDQLRSFFQGQIPSLWEVQPEGKWSAGQHVIHLVQSTKPLLNALRLPDFILKAFKSSPRSSRSIFEEYAGVAGQRIRYMVGSA